MFIPKNKSRGIATTIIAVVIVVILIVVIAGVYLATAKPSSTSIFEFI